MSGHTVQRGGLSIYLFIYLFLFIFYLMNQIFAKRRGECLFEVYVATFFNFDLILYLKGAILR